MLTSFQPLIITSEGSEPIPAQITGEHWACKDVAELGRKYEAKKNSPTPW